MKLTPKLLFLTGLTTFLSVVLFRRVMEIREAQEPDRLQRRVDDRLDELEARMEESLSE
ncbi:MAG: hypothetical protein KIS66_02135 [Fimbriimonadaceae bacterium]|nr:hypothetical protein [Fimbriimonadaceae bacterium]